MERPKQQALAFLLGALLVGGVLGFSADRVFRQAELTPAQRPNWLAPVPNTPSIR